MALMKFTSRSAPYSDKVLNGGLNSTAGSLGLQNNESSDLQNIDFNKFGSVLKRNGYTEINGTATTGTNLTADGLHWYEYDSSGTQTQKLVEVTGGKFLKMDSLDGTWDDITGAVSITATNHCDFSNFLNNVYVTNPTDAPFKWGGSGTATNMSVPTGLTKARYNEVFNNYLFYGHCTVSGTSHPSRIYWSTIKDADTWDAADNIDVAKDDGQEITGLKVLSDRLVIFKSRSIYNLFFTGDADIPFILPGGGKSNSAVGCVAPFSIQEVENGLVFLSYDGFYYYDGMNSYKISDRVTTTILGFNQTQFDSVVSMVQKEKNRYWAAFASSGQTEHDRVMVWDYFNNAWSVYVGMAPAAMATVYVGGLEERPYFSDYSGYTYRADIGSNDSPAGASTAITAYYYTNWKHYDDLCEQKGVPHVYVYYQSSASTLTFVYAYEFETEDQYSQTFSMQLGTDVYGTAVYGTGTYGGSGGAVKRRDLTGRGRVIRFGFKNSTLSETFQIDGFGSLPHLETEQ
jgi:hypothetical protein